MSRGDGTIVAVVGREQGQLYRLRASGAEDIGAGLARELRHHRTDRAGRAVREDALPRLKAAVLGKIPATR